ncbi:MAG: SDR family oxidoreductase [Actinobacteria bacterium]|nr:SDR family oxidoreductase [Actinomycetota bacterium]
MDKEILFYMSADTLEDVKPIGDVFDLRGKVAVVTGTVGLALSVINRLAECGAQVVFGSRTEEWGTLAEETLKDKGYHVSYLKTDVRKVDDCYALTGFAEKTYGTVDIVVPAAATWGARAFVDMKEEEWDDVIDTDLKGQYFTVQAAARSMIRGGKGGKVVTIASVAHRGDDMTKIAMMTNYNAAKAGVLGMTKGMAKELKQYGINVNCAAPGGMLTPGAMMNNLQSSALYGAEWDDDVKTYGLGTPIATTPDEVALVVVAMCTDISNYMYGQLIEADGGSQFSFQEKPWSYTMEGGLHG